MRLSQGSHESEVLKFFATKDRDKAAALKIGGCSMSWPAPTEPVLAGSSHADDGMDEAENACCALKRVQLARLSRP